MMIEVERYCACCGEVCGFEHVSCQDGHGAECPEFCCVECGAAVLVGILAEAPAPRVRVAA